MNNDELFREFMRRFDNLVKHNEVLTQAVNYYASEIYGNKTHLPKPTSLNELLDHMSEVWNRMHNIDRMNLWSEAYGEKPSFWEDLSWDFLTEGEKRAITFQYLPTLVKFYD